MKRLGLALILGLVLAVALAACGEDEDLTGERQGPPGAETITVTCGTCGLIWERDLAPACPSCGSTDVRPALQSIVEKSRGTQLSIQSLRVVHLLACEPAGMAALPGRSQNRDDQTAI